VTSTGIRKDYSCNLSQKIWAPYLSWWPEEIPSAAEFQHAQDNLNRMNHKVDYVLTHTVPETLFQGAARQQRWGEDYCPVRKMLDQP
jgi:hypothetical protein